MTPGRVLLLTLLACACATPLAAQEATRTGTPAFAADPALAKAGKEKFMTKACNACHTIGKGRMVGPDLKGVLDRRSVEWLKRWLKDPEQMMASDETARALLKEYNGIKMPNMKLKEAEIEALVHYLASETPAK